jgi:DNA-binding winged helix-turn-helix (wHTH) protein
MASEAAYRIGDWTFHPLANELVRSGERRRLEDRAARTLALLCERAGEPVPHEEIVAAVWNGRSQSANSLPVVVGQLRRALGDDARNPRFIETVPKKGYRLVSQPGADEARPRPKLSLPFLMLLLVVAAALLWVALRPATSEVAFADVANETGSASYDPLARATSELIATRLSRLGIVYRRGAPLGGETRLSGRLVLWNSEPTVSLTATAPDGSVTWSAMARGPADRLPANVNAAVAAFVQERAD